MRIYERKGILMPLTLAQLGKGNKIIKIGGSASERNRMRDMGFIEGEEVRVLSSVSGNLIVEVKNVRFALDKKFAARIMI